ncbi:MAG: hypothetical protein HAW66_06880, partial [Shewanella sp.]|nr:hypothetical protein [Shewanella sp.]
AKAEIHNSEISHQPEDHEINESNDTQISNKASLLETSPASGDSEKKAKIAAAVAKAKLRAKQKAAVKAADEEQ